MDCNYYIARLVIKHCFAEIRINDVPIFKQNVNADLTLEIPINYTIEYSGLQTLKNQIYPEFGHTYISPQAKSHVEIWRYDGSSTKIVPQEQVCKSLLSIDKENKIIPLKSDSKIFISNVAYQIERWSACEEIKDIKLISTEVIEYYNKIGKLLERKQFDEYLRYIKERECNICTALYLDENEISKRNDILFQYLNNGFILKPMTHKKQIQSYANNRIVTILDYDMRSALRFFNPETGEILAIELLLGRKHGQNSLCII